MEHQAPDRIAAEAAIQCIGQGYDVAIDLKLKYCKGNGLVNSRLIEIDEHARRDLVLPCSVSVPNVSKLIKCDKGERTRFCSDAISFQQMSEQFNQELSLSGKVPSGLFNSVFEFSGCWQNDAASNKTLSFDGVFITLYTVALEKSKMKLCDHVKKSVPSTWEPAGLAKFIDTFGTHIIVGIKMGGKDVIYMKQQHLSTLQPADVQKLLKTEADKRFSDANVEYIASTDPVNNNDEIEVRKQRLRFADVSPSNSYLQKEGIFMLCRRRGGKDDTSLSHYEWLSTVQVEPDVISMSFVPITSLLNGIPGSGFLSHAINLYLRYKPPLEDLHQFLEFQLPRHWAPVFNELPLGPQMMKQNTSAATSLQFSFMGPKLYINTIPVDVGRRPVTGLRLFLEGRRSNRLAIHMQHLSSLPKIFQLDEAGECFSQDSDDHKYYEKVQWKSFSHVCTAPVESDEDMSIVTGAQLHVGHHGFKKILFLRLRFSTVVGAVVVRHPDWDGSPAQAGKSGLLSTLISQHFSAVQKAPLPRPADVNVNSAVYQGGPPSPFHIPKLLKFVDTTEMSRGPEVPPGYWVVTGARFIVDKGKISLHVKYSLLTVVSPEDDDDDV